MAAFTALLATFVTTVLIAALVYAMHQRRELRGLAEAAARAWLALDDHFVARRDAIHMRLAAVSSGSADIDGTLTRLRHLLDLLDAARCMPDPLRTAAHERQLRTLLAEPGIANFIASIEQPLTPKSLPEFAAEIDDLAEVYDVAVSLFNLRLSRRPERWLARWEQLEPLPAFEIYQAAESAGSDWGAFAADARIRPPPGPHQDDDQPPA